jgi:biotin carboxyl carrier protein
MRYIATIDGAEQEFDVEELTGHSLRIRLDDEQVEVDVRRTGGTSFSILVGDRAFDFSVARQNDELIVASRGTATRVNLQDAARRVRGGAARPHGAGKAELKAMMPGRVVSLLVKVGDTVAAHQGVVVVEAMKMENELKSPKAGKVIEIKVAPGQTVEKGALLLVID